MNYFVDERSIVRQIWGRADTTLFIFAGAAAEFALNKAVDWLYFTGRLPADPLDRLFSTVTYARQILFSEEETALKSIHHITAIHKSVEASRGADIPPWAYRDVLFLLIDYSIRSFELLDRKLTPAEKDEVFNVFYRVGTGMQLTDLPTDFTGWEKMRAEHLEQNLVCSTFTADLYLQYKKHLGILRFTILKQVQLLTVPNRVSNMLSLPATPWLLPFLKIYKVLRRNQLEGLLKNVLLPIKYKAQILQMDKGFPHKKQPMLIK
ncbi:MAG: oxygenase MpaB family protein [Mucilaginibacter sp.]